MRRRAMTYKKRQLGQVMIETALAAIGIVVLAFLVAKVGMWLNRSLVQRNANFQATRVAAASTSPGLPFAAPAPIHLLGPTADSTGGLPPQPLGPSAIPPTCSGGGAALLTQAQLRRADLAAQQASASLIQQQATDTSNKARDLIIANPSSGGRVCSGNQCKGANWFWDEAQSLQYWKDKLTADQAQLATDQAKLAADQAQLAADQARLASDEAALAACPGCVTTTDAKGNTTTDCSAHDFCVGAWSAAVIADTNAIAADQNNITTDQNNITTDQNNITTDQNKINQICADTGTGNPWVGGAPACTVPSIEAYANQVNAKGNSVSAQVDPLVIQLKGKENLIQQDLVEAEDKEAQGRAQCASGRDP